ncbi:hypothetical protein Zmor_010435 [Zophobas morio]|uniref:Major facilitator superfamily (MFS) profile domain-containing protein n=1 Tax=Zophobas morio TaxID=2755281 RepID=A0AA38IKS4_9CUCU|nr:hypothetical protein Zmor_010435 [Zophobas morio]
MASTTKKWTLELMTCRRILFIMVTSGFILNGLLKTMFNIAIVTMIKKNNETSNSELFDWNEDQKQNILGMFFWGFALTKIPSGRLAEMFGSKKVSGYSMVLAAVLTIITPVIAHLNYYALLTSRVLMGFLIGASWPALMPLSFKWIAPTEQSVFMSCITSSSIGYALSSILGGFLISEYGWPSVFYFSGTISLLWSGFWFYLIYDSPRQHPRISPKERQELENKIKETGESGKKIKFTEIPWKQILSSGPVWAIAFAQTASFFGNMTINAELPSYLDQVLHYNIQQNGILSSLPNWGVYISSLSYGYIADRLLKSERMSVTAVRKVFGTYSLIVPSIFMILLGVWGNVAAVALTSFYLALIANAAVTAGHCPNILEVSPNYSGTICGLVNMVSAFGVYVATRLVALLLSSGHTFQDWRPFFWIQCGVYCVGGIIYLVLCSGRLQSWDSKRCKNETVKCTAEGIPLNKDVV